MSTDKTSAVSDGEAVVETMTQAEFARRRGVSRSTVNEYKNKGYLVMTDDGKVSVLASEEKLADHLDPTRGGSRSSAPQKASPKNTAYMTAKTREMEAKAAKQEMDTRERAGELLDRVDVQRAAFTLARQTQEAGMAIADRLSSILAAEGDAAKVHGLLTSELREVFNDIADQAEGMFQ